MSLAHLRLEVPVSEVAPNVAQNLHSTDIRSFAGQWTFTTGNGLRVTIGDTLGPLDIPAIYTYVDLPGVKDVNFNISLHSENIWSVSSRITKIITALETTLER